MTALAWQSGGVPGGPAVILVHSWGRDGPGDWAATGWVDALTAAGHAVWVPDLPGHGASADVVLGEGEPAGATARLVAADLDELGIAEAAAVGYADGCVTAGHLAAREPERITRLVLVGCDDRVEIIPRGAEVATALRDPGARVWNVEVSEALGQARRDRRNHLPTLALWAQRSAWPAAPRLGSLRTPVLLAVGGEDAPRRERAPRLAALFHDARVVTVPGTRRGALAAPELHRTAVDFLAG